MIRVKICCIGSPQEAAMAVKAGASALGLVAAMPSGPGIIPLDTMPGIVASVPPGVATFLLSSKEDFPAIAAEVAASRVNTLQIVDFVDPGVYGRLRAECPWLKLVQVIHIVDRASVAAAIDAAPFVDALLLDSGNPAAKIKELGGTGRVHDWTLSREIVERCGKPVYLAGGLTPENVGEAIAAVRPFGLDICSGVRTDGALDPVKLQRFFASVRDAEAEPGC